MMMLQGFIGFQDCIRDCNIRFENVFNFVSIRLKIIPRGTEGNSFLNTYVPSHWESKYL